MEKISVRQGLNSNAFEARSCRTGNKIKDEETGPCAYYVCSGIRTAVPLSREFHDGLARCACCWSELISRIACCRIPGRSDCHPRAERNIVACCSAEVTLREMTGRNNEREKVDKVSNESKKRFDSLESIKVTFREVLKKYQCLNICCKIISPKYAEKF